MKYHCIWSYLASTIATFASNQDTYIFLGQCIKFFFPLRVFSVEKDFYDKRVELNIFRNVFKTLFPKIEKSLTLKHLKPVLIFQLI